VSTATLPLGLVPLGAAPSDPRIHEAMRSRTDFAEQAAALARDSEAFVARRRKAAERRRLATARRHSIRSEHREASQLLAARGRIALEVPLPHLDPGPGPGPGPGPVPRRGRGLTSTSESDGDSESKRGAEGLWTSVVDLAWASTGSDRH